MKKIHFIVLIFLAFSSCKKETSQINTSTTSINGSITGTVSINGISYPTVVIGSQTWTSINYNGSGGVEYPNTSNDPKYGKLYTIAEAKVITLPTGWRLPTVADFSKMLTNYDPSVSKTDINPVSTHTVEFMAKDGWLLNTGIIPGTNTSGFDAYPAGEMDGNYNYVNRGYGAIFWTYVPYISWQASYGIGYYGSQFLFEKLNNSNQVIISGVSLPQPEKQSIRFVKDN